MIGGKAFVEYDIRGLVTTGVIRANKSKHFRMMQEDFAHWQRYHPGQALTFEEYLRTRGESSYVVVLDKPFLGRDIAHLTPSTRHDRGKIQEGLPVQVAFCLSKDGTFFARSLAARPEKVRQDHTSCVALAAE